MKTRMRVAAAVIAGTGMIAAGSGAALASSGTAITTTHATASTHQNMAMANQLTWHPLHLLNGWKAASARYYGAPSYAIQDGILYLSGILQAPHPTMAPEFAVLPPGTRPRHFLWLIYGNFGGGVPI